MQDLKDKIRETLDQGSTDYEVVLAVDFILHQWLREQETEVIRQFIPEVL